MSGNADVEDNHQTYGIETISKLLVATKALTHPDHAPKRQEYTFELPRPPPADNWCARYEDTVVIYGQYVLSAFVLSLVPFSGAPSPHDSAELSSLAL